MKSQSIQNFMFHSSQLDASVKPTSKNLPHSLLPTGIWWQKLMGTFPLIPQFIMVAVRPHLWLIAEMTKSGHLLDKTFLTCQPSKQCYITMEENPTIRVPKPLSHQIPLEI